MPNDVSEVVLDDSEVIAVVVDVRRQQQRVAATHDPLLAEIGRAPIDFQPQLVRLHDLWRLGKSFSKLGEESHVTVCRRLVVDEGRIGELTRPALSRVLDERASTSVVPRLLRLAAGWHRGAAARSDDDDVGHSSRKVTWWRLQSEEARIERNNRVTIIGLRRFPSAVRPMPTLVPVWKDCLLDTDTPVSAFAKLSRGPFAFLLESAPAGGETWARYTYLGTEPRCRVETRSTESSRTGPKRSVGIVARTPDDPLADLAVLVEGATPADVPELGAFWGGVVGYFSYDIVRLIEKLPNTTRGRIGCARRDVRVHAIAGDPRQSARSGASVISVPVSNRRAMTDALRSLYDRRDRRARGYSRATA